LWDVSPGPNGRRGFEVCFFDFFIQQRNGLALALPVPGLTAFHVGEFVFDLD
jgi:hypothetical protein